jgi:hypothetical protein
LIAVCNPSDHNGGFLLKHFVEVAMRFFCARLIAIVMILSIASTTCHAAEGKGKTFTDRKEAGEDYKLQGEYAGDMASGDGKLGIQVIALGNGKFRAVAYPGGLPGDGWVGGDKHSGEGELKGGEVEFKPENADAEEGPRAVLKGDTIMVMHGDETIAELKKVNRKSPTLKAKPPKGAIVLFDGTNTDEWENGTLVSKKWLGATGTATKRKFGDHTMHIEFRTPFMPEATGQARGNSGVYIQGRYECQVLDSFGLEGEDNECGGIYSISKPKLNMCFPPLVWQTYDIDFTAAKYDDDGNKTKNARVTIKHNGVPIYEDLEIKHGTPGYHPEGPEKDSLWLQDHGNPVVFRNIWVVEK